MTASLVPLRLSRERVVLYGIALAVIASIPFIIFPSWFHDVAFRGDFANFWSAGANAGTPALLDPAALAQWQLAHHITPQLFVYPPGVAWIYAPLARLAPMPAMVVGELGMIALLAAAGVLAARIYGCTTWFALVAVLAWGPAVNAIELGQNAAVALLAIFAAIGALVARRQAVAGLAVGLLLYKPSVALPFVVLLVLRAQWRALGVVAVAALGWYLLSVLAAHGDWAWPAAYVRLVERSSAAEFAGNSHKTYTIPTLLLSAGASQAVAVGVAAAVFAAAIPLLMRTRMLEAASMTSTIGLATSVHAWPYEATLLLPAVFFAGVGVHEPWRTRVVIAAYVVAALALVVPYAAHSLALLPLGAVAAWFWSGYRKLRWS